METVYGLVFKECHKKCKMKKNGLYLKRKVGLFLDGRNYVILHAIL